MNKIKTNLTLFLILFSLSVFSQELKPDSIYYFKFPELPQPLFAKLFKKDAGAQMSFYLPANYNKNKKFPLVLWLGGGSGGMGDQASIGREIFQSKNYIIASFPLFKGEIPALKSDSTNYWRRMMMLQRDEKLIWDSYKPMLEKLFVVIPNIDRKRTFMGGFSNGAHTTAILINSEENKIAKYFKNFFFIEGGNRLAEFKRIKKSSLLFMQGAKNNRNWLEAVFTKSQQEKIQSEFIKMEGYGHDFPEEYYQHLIDWIKMN